MCNNCITRSIIKRHSENIGEPPYWEIAKTPTIHAISDQFMVSIYIQKSKTFPDNNLLSIFISDEHHREYSVTCISQCDVDLSLGLSAEISSR